MADVEFPVAGGVFKKLKDMGDGTHAEIVVASGGGGGGSSEVTITNWPSEQPVTGPATMTELSGVTGLLNASPYADDTGAGDGSIIGLLKGIYVQNVQIIAHLSAIETNTEGGA